MRLEVNGESVEYGGAPTVADLVAWLCIAPETALVEHNGTALFRRQWPETLLRDGDKIEILTVVAGG